MEKESKIYVSGHTGLVGRAILEKLKEKEYCNIITKTHKELDLTNQMAVKEFFEKEKPEYVFLCAAKVGGIWVNNIYRADFIYQNLAIQLNVIHYSYLTGVKKLLFLGSSCIYPKHCPQPIKEEFLLTGELEYTNEPYAIAKIAGLKMCESYNIQYGTNFICVMPTNLYGPNDNFDLETSHVLPALIRKIHLAKLLQQNCKDEIVKDLGVNDWNEAEKILEKHGISKDKITLWGTGSPRREFLYVEDLAEACIFLMERVNFTDLIKNKKEIKNTHINIGTGKDISIKELATLVSKIIGFEGDILWDKSKPDGTPRKLLDVSKIHALGWRHKISLEEGIRKTYESYLKGIWKKK